VSARPETMMEKLNKYNYKTPIVYPMVSRIAVDFGLFYYRDVGLMDFETI